MVINKSKPQFQKSSYRFNALTDAEYGGAVVVGIPCNEKEEMIKKRWILAGVAAPAIILLILLLCNFTSNHRDNAAMCLDQSEECYVNLSDEELFNSFQGPQNTIGQYCYIQVGSEDNACQFYVKAQPSTISTDKGWPRTPLSDGDKGTGCVGTSKSCYFLDTAYNLTQSERDSFCTSNIASNAAAQLRHAIQHHACGFQSVDFPTTTSTSTGSSDETVNNTGVDNKDIKDSSILQKHQENQDGKDDRSWWDKTTATVSSWFGKSHPTKKAGGGRDWLVNAIDGTIMAKHDPSFFLGYGPSPLILVRKDSSNKLIFPAVANNDSWIDFKAIRNIEKDFGAKPEAIGFVPQTDVQTFDRYEYYDTLVHPSLQPFPVKFQDSNFIVNTDGFVLDVAFWNITEGTKVNFVKPVDHDTNTFIKGGGRDWTWNGNDGTIASKLNPDLVIGFGDTGLIITQDEKHAICLSQGQELANMKPVLMNLQPKYNSGPSFIVKTSLDKKTYDGWRYRNVIVQRKQEGVSATEIIYDGNFILTSDNEYALNIASWKMEPLTSVNFVGGDK